MKHFSEGNQDGHDSMKEYEFSINRHSDDDE